MSELRRRTKSAQIVLFSFLSSTKDGSADKASTDKKEEKPTTGK